MILATILLLCPVPQAGVDVAKAVVDNTAVVSTETAKNSLAAQPLPSMPQPKVKSDASGSGEAVTPNYAAMGIQPVRPARERVRETARERKIWYALSVTGSGAAAFDAWSTRRALSQNMGTEANPLLRPFAHSKMMYAAAQVSPVVMDFLGKRMMTSQHSWVRHMWWLPQTAGAGLSLTAGAHNTGLAQ